MTRTIHAIYEEGVLRPLEDPGLAEHQQVVIELRLGEAAAPVDTLQAWQSVYEGLSEDDLEAVETITLDRSAFMSPAR